MRDNFKRLFVLGVIRDCALINEISKNEKMNFYLANSEYIA